MMPKSDTIAEILRSNPTANPTFLAEFSNQELDEYLQRLRQLSGRSPAFDRGHPCQGELVAGTSPPQPA